MVFEGEFFLAGRVLFGLLFVYNGYNHFANYEGRVQYAEYKDVPAAGPMVLVSGSMLVLGGLGVILGAYPVLSAGALALFLLVTTPVIHDFWAAPEEERQNEFNHFLKNVGLLGAALIVLSLGSEAWTYAVGGGLF